MTKMSLQGAGPVQTASSRRRQVVYGASCVAGAALPLSQVLPWMADNGIDLPLFFEELFANRISSFFAWDVLVSAAVVLAFLALDGGGLPRAQRALAAVATCSVGVSFGLPLYLLLRERHSRRASE
jgi:hypothetical protein